MPCSREVLRGADAGEHQELRRVEGAAGEDHLARAVVPLHLVVHPGLRLGDRLRIGAVEVCPFPALDADGALRGVEEDPGRQGAHADHQLLRVGGDGGVDQLARAGPPAARGRRRREADPLELRRPPVVGVLRHEVGERAADPLLPCARSPRRRWSAPAPGRRRRARGRGRWWRASRRTRGATGWAPRRAGAADSRSARGARSSVRIASAAHEGSPVSSAMWSQSLPCP